MVARSYDNSHAAKTEPNLKEEYMVGTRRHTYLTTKELAQLLRLSSRTLERWRYEGHGPVFAKHGRRVLYNLEDVERFTSRRFQSTSEVNALKDGSSNRPRSRHLPPDNTDAVHLSPECGTGVGNKDNPS